MNSSDSKKEEVDVNHIALELFKERSSQTGISPEQIAIDCFRDAKAFAKIAERVLYDDIELAHADSNPLDAAFAPNLKRTHPINLISKAWGDLTKVKAALVELEANPGAEHYEPFGWGKPEINQARVLFPSVVERAQLLSAEV